MTYSKRIQKKVKQDYDLIAEDFSHTRQSAWKDFNLFLPYLEADFKILDLGCGNGRLIDFLKKYKIASYVGLDQSAALLIEAEKLHPGHKFVCQDMSEPIHMKKKFDALFAIASFHHIPPSHQLRTLHQWKKLLKRGGYIFMCNWNLHQPRFWPMWLRSLVMPTYGVKGLLVPWGNSGRGNSGNRVKRYYFAFSKTRLEKLFKKAGYSIILNEYTADGKSSTLLCGKNIVTVVRYENF